MNHKFLDKKNAISAELDEILELLSDEIPDDPNTQVAELSRLNVLLARCNVIYVEAKDLYDMAIAESFGVYAEYISNMPPSIASQFIKASCHEFHALVFLAERLDRTIVHICDNLRTQISFAKEQLRLSGIQ